MSIVIATLLICNVPYERYVPAGKIMSFLLGPATVALAVPLYRKREILRCYFVAILAGATCGAFVSMVTVAVVARGGGLSRELIVSLIPKSVTIPFAIELSQLYGGSPALTIVFTVATATFIAVIGPAFLTRFGISDPVVRGLALGSIAHGQGTAVALLEGDEAGSMAGLAMVLAGVITTLLAPFLVPLLAG